MPDTMQKYIKLFFIVKFVLMKVNKEIVNIW